MDRMLGMKEVGEILSLKTPEVIRRTMRQMVHMEGPLRVSESALQAWINQRTYRPAGETESFDFAQDDRKERIPRRRNGRVAG